MSFEDKIRNAESSDWLTEGIPKWQVWLIIKWAIFKAKIYLFWKKVRKDK